MAGKVDLACDYKARARVRQRPGRTPDMRALLLEAIHDDAAFALRDAGFEVERYDRALTEDELLEQLPGVHVLGLRSNTTLTRKAVEAADELLAVGAFCIGTNQIDLPATLDRGVAVFNAPFSNT